MFLIRNSALPNSEKYPKKGNSPSPATRMRSYTPGDVQPLLAEENHGNRQTETVFEVDIGKQIGGYFRNEAGTAPEHGV